jgi:hypothetical protein
MAKKIVLVLLIVAVSAGVLGAQQTAQGRKIALGLDVAPLFKGLIWSDSNAKNSLFALAPHFEYLIRPGFTIGASGDLYFGKASNVDIFYFGAAFQGRWYPLSTGLDKLFLGASVGFNAFSLDGETDSKKGGFMGITFSLKAGYKLMLTSKFFMEPSMAFVYAKTPSSVTVPTPQGWQPGLVIGMTL